MKTVKLLWFSDLHLSTKDKLGIINSEGKNTRLEEKIKFLDSIVAAVDFLNPDIVVDGGDVFDSGNTAIPAALRKLYVEHFIVPMDKVKKAYRKDLQVRILKANHDSDGEYDALSSEAILLNRDEYKRVAVVESAQVEWIAGVQFVFLPYNEEFPHINNPRPDMTIVCGHFTIPNVGFPDRKMIELDPSKYKKAIIGHIHTRIEGDKFIYPGSCFPQNFKEVEDRGDPFVYFSLFEIVVDEKLENEVVHDEIIEVRETQYSCSSIITYPNQYFKIFASEIGNLPIRNNSIVKIKIKGSKESSLAINRLSLKDKYPQAAEIFIEYDLTESALTNTTAVDVDPNSIVTGIVPLYLGTQLNFDLDLMHSYIDYGLDKMKKAQMRSR